MYVVLCNCPPDEAQTLASALVEGGLAACVNILSPVTSVYRWEGKVVTDTEATLLIKTSHANAPRLRERIVELHPYSVPEVVVLPVDCDKSHAAYVDWVRSQS